MFRRSVKSGSWMPTTRPPDRRERTAVVKRVEFRRSAVCCHDDLARAVNERVQGVTELLLHLFAVQELHVVDQEQIDRAQRLLEGQRGLGFQGRHEFVHEVLGRQVEHLASACPCLRRHGLHEVRFAEANRSVEVERVESDRATGCDLPGGCQGQVVRLAFDEGFERVFRIECCALQNVTCGVVARVTAAERCRNGLSTCHLGCIGERVTGRFRCNLLCAGRGCQARLNHGCLARPDCAADRQLDAMDIVAFALPQAHQLVIVIVLNPLFEKPGGNRQSHSTILMFLEVNACKPAGKYVVAQFCTKLFLDPLPMFGAACLLNLHVICLLYKMKNSPPQPFFNALLLRSL